MRQRAGLPRASPASLTWQPVEPQGADLRDRVGLCLGCRHVRIVVARAGNRYYRCERSTFDPRYPKYPPLPVLACAGREEPPAPR